jgi:AbiU2
VTELDAWQEADLLIRQHRENAELEAARLADLMLDRGDKAGSQEWEHIKRIIEAKRVAAVLQPPPPRPVSPEEDEVIAVAERIKQNLVTAIAAGQVLRPAASDTELIGCFNIGCAGDAFNLVRHSLLFSQVMALMRLWDKRKDVHSIPTLVRLLSKPGLVAKLVERERQASHDTRQEETVLGEGKTKLPFSPARSTPDQREHELRAEVSSWLGKVRTVQGCAEISRLRNYRHDLLAHSAARSHRPQIPLPYYGDEQEALKLTIPVASLGFRLATGTDHDFSTDESVWDRSQRDMWETIRSAARGERYVPAAQNLDEQLREIAERGITSIAIRG